MANKTVRVLARITHRGKPPAVPGDSPGFDLYDGRCEFLISTRRKEIHDQRISEPEPYEVGLKNSRESTFGLADILSRRLD